MRILDWDEVKNGKLKTERNVSFEDVQAALDEGRLLAEIAHRNNKRYPHQRVFIVIINNYAYLVPYVENERKLFLKTIIPSRKATKQYLRKGAENE